MDCLMLPLRKKITKTNLYLFINSFFCFLVHVNIQKSAFALTESPKRSPIGCMPCKYYHVVMEVSSPSWLKAFSTHGCQFPTHGLQSPSSSSWTDLATFIALVTHYVSVPAFL